jgi:hypothetical protein
LVEVGEWVAWGRIWEASWRRAERVWGVEGWERRVVRREVKEVVRVWVAGRRRVSWGFSSGEGGGCGSYRRD